MKKIRLIILAAAILVACENPKTYTDTYQYKYKRPIALLMSHELDSLQLSGNKVVIGVIDAGFSGFKVNEYTRNLTVLDYKDFIDKDTTNFFGATENNHGTLVTTSIGGKKEEYIHGLAYNAQYILAKTEDVTSELTIEENRLTKAVAWLLSKKVDVINISVAYTTFDDADYYTRADLNGKTALSSRYLDSVLQANPNLIITVSAGNEGNKPWKNIMFPSDVKEVITVGSTDFEGETRRKTSGIGTKQVSYIKPDVVTYPMPPGNSHTAPVIAGLCALLKELKPSITRKQIIKALHKTSSNAKKPNREIGYGVPNTAQLLKAIQ